MNGSTVLIRQNRIRRIKKVPFQLERDPAQTCRGDRLRSLLSTLGGTAVSSSTHRPLTIGKNLQAAAARRSFLFCLNVTIIATEKLHQFSKRYFVDLHIKQIEGQLALAQQPPLSEQNLADFADL